jgi:hypothetical protein
VEHRNFLLCEESPISTLESFLRQSGKDNSVEFNDSVAESFKDTTNDTVLS